MRNVSKTALLAGVAAGMLGLSGFAGPALAFDAVTWTWDKAKAETITVDGNITFDLNPSGWVELEKLQVFIGDLNATSTVSGIDNYQPQDGVNTGTINFTVDYAGVANDQVDPSEFGTPTDGTYAELGGDLAGSGYIVGTHDEGSDDILFTATFDNIEVSVAPTTGLDALTQLPEVVSNATAVGNNQSIDSQVALSLHDGQFVFGGFNTEATSGASLQDVQDGLALIQTGNTNLSGALALAMGGAFGLIEPASITATSTVSDILNATVDSSATAVANNTTINLGAVTPDDANLEGDFVQMAYADLAATSNVSGVVLNGYYNLGQLDRPIINSTATAVGNNLSVTVTSPALPQ